MEMLVRREVSQTRKAAPGWSISHPVAMPGLVKRPSAVRLAISCQPQLEPNAAPPTLSAARIEGPR